MKKLWLVLKKMLGMLRVAPAVHFYEDLCIVKTYSQNNLQQQQKERMQDDWTVSFFQIL